MTLPRFTQGQIGRLSFSDLNSAFEKIDDINRSTDATSTQSRLAGDVLIGTIIAEQQGTGKFSFIEVVRDSTAGTSGYSSVQNNGLPTSRTSSNGVDDYAYPVLATAGITPVVGSTYLLLAQYTTGGQLYYAPVTFGSGLGQGSFASIVSSVSAGSNRWLYTVATAQWNSLNNDWLVSGFNQFSAYNSCEWAVDSTSYGVGFIPAGNPSQVIRQPIKAGTVVTVEKASSILPGVVIFSVPNGYRVVC